MRDIRRRIRRLEKATHSRGEKSRIVIPGWIDTEQKEPRRRVKCFWVFKSEEEVDKCREEVVAQYPEAEVTMHICEAWAPIAARIAEDEPESAEEAQE